MENKIELGDTVKCKYTGFKGVVVARTDFINGCVQFCIAPKVGKDNKMGDEMGIDEDSLTIIKKRVIGSIMHKTRRINNPPGGASKKMPSRRNY